MKFKDAIECFETIVTNGALSTRLKYDYGFTTIFEVLNNEAGRKALTAIYEGDIAVAKANHLPIILNTATYRTSRNHLRAAGCSSSALVSRINITCIQITNEFRNKKNHSHHPIFVGAPLGSMFDAYSTESIPTVEEALAYHSEQIEIFNENDVDFINVVTIPSLLEAMGISLAAERVGLDYTIGFILNDNGNLLDGTTLENAIQAIDQLTTRKPLGYLITCTHSSAIFSLSKHHRILGMQPNGSDLSRHRLGKIDVPVADSPEKFASDIVALKELFGLKIVGGCCGTSRAHLECVASALKVVRLKL